MRECDWDRFGVEAGGVGSRGGGGKREDQVLNRCCKGWLTGKRKWRCSRRPLQTMLMPTVRSESLSSLSDSLDFALRRSRPRARAGSLRTASNSSLMASIYVSTFRRSGPDADNPITLKRLTSPRADSKSDVNRRFSSINRLSSFARSRVRASILVREAVVRASVASTSDFKDLSNTRGQDGSSRVPKESKVGTHLFPVHSAALFKVRPFLPFHLLKLQNKIARDSVRSFLLSENSFEGVGTDQVDVLTLELFDRDGLDPLASLVRCKTPNRRRTCQRRFPRILWRSARGSPQEIRSLSPEG